MSSYKRIDSMWFQILTDTGAQSLGVVATEDEFGEKKLRMGIIPVSTTEEADAQYIIENGQKITNHFIDFINANKPGKQ